MRLLFMTFALSAGLGLQPAAAQDSGTAAEAQAMLTAAAAAVAADENDALASFTAGDAPFRAKDLYVFCAKGKFMTAHGADAALVGQESIDWVDKAGKPFIRAMWDSAKEGELTVVDYMWPRPGAKEPVPKASYVTRIGEQMCGVGYYP